MNKHGQPSSRSGFSLIDVILALAMLALAAGIAAVSIPGMQHLSKVEQTQQQMVSLLRACYQHRIDSGQVWPDFNVERKEPMTIDAASEDTFWASASSLEYLAHAAELPNTLFTSPFTGRGPDPATQAESRTDRGFDGRALRRTSFADAFAFDWAAPRESGERRPIFALRHADELAQYPAAAKTDSSADDNPDETTANVANQDATEVAGVGTIVVFADGHHRLLTAVQSYSSSGPATWAIASETNPAGPIPGDWRRMVNPYGSDETILTPDGIFDPHDDGEPSTVLSLGEGHIFRSWLK